MISLLFVYILFYHTYFNQRRYRIDINSTMNGMILFLDLLLTSRRLAVNSNFFLEQKLLLLLQFQYTTMFVYSTISIQFSTSIRTKKKIGYYEMGLRLLTGCYINWPHRFAYRKRFA